MGMWEGASSVSKRWVIAYSFVIPFSTRANCVGSTPSADSNILCSISKCGANTRLRKGLCRIGLADCDRIKKGVGWQAELLIIIREKKICKISKAF